MKLIKIKNEVREMSFEEVYNEFEPLVYSMVNGTQIGSGMNKIDGEDLKQILSITMWKAYNKYDVTRKINFSTLLVNSMKNEIVNLRTSVSRLVRSGSNDVTYLDAKMKEDDSKTFLEDVTCDRTLEEEIFNPYEKEVDVMKACQEDIVEKVCTNEKDVENLKLLLRLEETTISNLAREMGVSKQSLSQKVKRIRRKFQERLTSKNL